MDFRTVDKRLQICISIISISIAIIFTIIFWMTFRIDYPNYSLHGSQFATVLLKLEVPRVWHAILGVTGWAQSRIAISPSCCWCQCVCGQLTTLWFSVNNIFFHMCYYIISCPLIVFCALGFWKTNFSLWNCFSPWNSIFKPWLIFPVWWDNFGSWLCHLSICYCHASHVTLISMS